MRYTTNTSGVYAPDHAKSGKKLFSLIHTNFRGEGFSNSSARNFSRTMASLYSRDIYLLLKVLCHQKNLVRWSLLTLNVAKSGKLYY